MSKKEEYTIKSLEFLQNIIARLNNNSFNIKVFATTIFGLLITLYIEKKNILFIYVCLVCMIMFTLMDSLYLCNERKFRKIYESLIKSSKDKDLKVFQYDINNIKDITFFNVTVSYSILLIYLSMISVLIFIAIFYYN